MFMARVVKSLGHGGQSLAQRELGWCRNTIRKGAKELESGPIEDNFSARGRKRAEEKLPNLLEDIKHLVDEQSQTDPTFRTQWLYTRLSARAVREALKVRFGYSDEELPAESTIRAKLNGMGYKPRAVQKSRPKKSSQKRTPSSKS